MIAIETPFRDFLAFWAEAAGRPRAEQRRLWHERYTDRHPDLFALHKQVFRDVDDDLDDALPRFAAVAETAETRFAALQLERAITAVDELFGLPITGKLVAFVGTFGPMAWLDPYDGGYAAFFALEKLDDVATNAIHAVHELTHLVHFVHRQGVWPDLCAGQELVMEGLAVQVTKQLFPEAPPSAWYAVADFSAYERAVDEAWSWAIPELLRCFDAPIPEETKRFFWPDWARERRDVPEQFGYLVGDRVVAELRERHALAEIACWSTERARAEARAVLEATLRGR